MARRKAWLRVRFERTRDETRGRRPPPREGDRGGPLEIDRERRESFVRESWAAISSGGRGREAAGEDVAEDDFRSDRRSILAGVAARREGHRVARGRDPRRARPGRHGRRLSRFDRELGEPVPLKVTAPIDRRTPSGAIASSARSASRAGSRIPTCVASTTCSATRPRRGTSRCSQWSCSRARRSPRASSERDRSLRRPRCRSRSSSPPGSRPRTAPGSCTATSRPPT